MDGFQSVVHLGEIFKVCGDTLRPFVTGTEVDEYGIVAIGQTENVDGILKVFAKYGPNFQAGIS